MPGAGAIRPISLRMSRMVDSADKQVAHGEVEPHARFGSVIATRRHRYIWNAEPYTPLIARSVSPSPLPHGTLLLGSPRAAAVPPPRRLFYSSNGGSARARLERRGWGHELRGVAAPHAFGAPLWHPRQSRSSRASADARYTPVAA